MVLGGKEEELAAVGLHADHHGERRGGGEPRLPFQETYKIHNNFFLFC